METLRCRLEEQRGRHEGGSEWVGTAGTSPFGAHGYNPEGVRIGQEDGRHRRAVKVWDQRAFRDLDDAAELGTRNIRLALRRLRRFARTGAAEELDLDGTIRSTAEAGYLDVKLHPERCNAVKVLLFLDGGGSMDWHIRRCEELFSAARGAFRHLEHFYFHNCLYERVWKDTARRWNDWTATAELIRTCPPDWKLVLVGDAGMSPYEITHPGGSVERLNEEAGWVWLKRITAAFPHAAWLHPLARGDWDDTASVQMIRQAMDGRMFPLTLEGIDLAMRELAR